MRSKIHALKNRPYLPEKVREAFESWTELMAEAKAARLFPSEQTLTRTYLGHLIVDKGGSISELAWLEKAKIITDDDVIDWETSVVA